MRVIFFGTPQFAADVLQYLLDHGVDIVAVVSKPDRAKGRSKSLVPTPVKVIAAHHSPALPIYQPERASSSDFADLLISHRPDLFVVVAYGEIVSQQLLNIPGLGCINLHASLLPKYRGAAPIQRAIIEGESESGVTIMHMVRKMDAGDMIKNVTVSIEPDMTYGELEKLLCEAGKKAFLEVIRQFVKELPLGVSQDHALATTAPKIELEDCQIDWNLAAQSIHNLVRGVNPFPGAWCYVKIRGEKKRLKIHRTRIVFQDPSLRPGTILNALEQKSNLIISTGDQALELSEVQLEGKKNMSSADLIRGICRSEIIFLAFE